MICVLHKSFSPLYHFPLFISFLSRGFLFLNLFCAKNENKLSFSCDIQYLSLSL